MKFLAGTRLGRTGFASVVVVAALGASPAAMADCTGTGLGAALSPLLPFASGGAVNSLISAINTANTAFLTQGSAFVSAPPNPKPNQEGGGVWARAIGGDITTKSTSTTTNISVVGVPVPGTITCNNSTSLQFAGVQAGTDIARLNWNGFNVHVGSTVGYLGARARDKSSAGALNPLGGTFEDNLQVPFAGMYVAITKGGFFVDGQLRGDYYQNSLNDPLVSGLYSQKLDARGIAFSGNVGYNMPLQNNWFIEPSAGIVVSKVKVDPLTVTGTLVTGTGLTLPGTLHVSDINSQLGRLSVRGGTTIASGNMVWQPFAIASVYHEFQGAISSSFDNAGLPVPLNLLSGAGQISSTNIGTYGQIGVGVSGQVVGTGLLGYLRADYRNGSNIEGYSLNGGIRYQFTPEMISPTPMYAKAPVKAPVAVVTPYDWNGFFIGGSAGILTGRTAWDFVAAGTSTNPRYAGGLGGIQAGYDWQRGKWVFGVEGNINATNAHGARACPNIDATCEAWVNWIGTATGRVGYAFWDRSIIYGRGGIAFANTKLLGSCNTGPNNVFLLNCGANDTQTKVGWTLGFGSEFALAKNWTVRSETNYYDIGTQRYSLAGELVDLKHQGFVTTVGVNYRFNPGGTVVAKY
ncbi:autotransporter outer membrane beta-barrel domain-containing protein [Bradyrhizobium guangdongense]|uniref:autotransporter outer membrane beta-barrel domain-containing protein n=1 Tax=Bradyrhizobium guangdongense TaxID=1325090 RepID=UPI001128157F|nr:autotransporter outer membrane beta-barrel domain-containing protein [Bradyrhizobium guangdongense]TPQ30114.1 autotransporter outer membrane beta-barrel domain-containing protein [Bradyrhizobium guangdongense]